ncbi:hypothetical protein [Streptomyces sp. NPDC006324]|uniref:hypothetical protein n=1 Tax=Streptomyces sp. NPDC006324 TaxID=3156751 RepID=UPI0033A14488
MRTVVREMDPDFGIVSGQGGIELPSAREFQALALIVILAGMSEVEMATKSSAKLMKVHLGGPAISATGSRMYSIPFAEVEGEGTGVAP